MIRLNSLNIYLPVAIIFFLYQPHLQGKPSLNKPPLIPYMDQVINRKKPIIFKKCLKHIEHHKTGFLMVEIKVSQNGKTKSRLIATEINNKEFLNCTLSVLNRVRFKKMKRSVSRIYRFFIL